MGFNNVYRKNDVTCRTNDAPIVPTVTPTFGAPGIGIPKWVDKYGAIYETYDSGAVKKSVDGGKTWTQLYQYADGEKYGTTFSCALLVTETGRIVLGTSTGYVITSDEAQAVFSDAFQFTSGFASSQFGSGVYENYVWIPAYSDSETDGLELYLSKDHGATFAKVFTATKVDETGKMHIHDIAYDPYAKRFWMVCGDAKNANVFYSDDECATWTPVFNAWETDKRNIQFTTIAVFPHGIVFGSDNYRTPDGLYYWPRPPVVLHPTVDPNSFRSIFKFTDTAGLKNWAEKAHRLIADDDEITVIPWYGIGDTTPCLLASVNGLDWYEIWRGQDAQQDQFHVAGMGLDSRHTVYGCLYNATTYKYISWSAVLPAFERKQEVEYENRVILRDDATAVTVAANSSLQYVISEPLRFVSLGLAFFSADTFTNQLYLDMETSAGWVATQAACASGSRAKGGARVALSLGKKATVVFKNEDASPHDIKLYVEGFRQV